MKKLLLVPAVIGLFAFAGKTPSIKIDRNPNHPIAYAINAKGVVLDSSEVDELGNYHFQSLPIGTYDVIISESGKDKVTIKGIEHLGPNYSYHMRSQNTLIRTNPSYTGDISIRGSRSDAMAVEIDDVRDLAKPSHDYSAKAETGRRSPAGGIRGMAAESTAVPHDAMIMSIGNSGRSGSSSIKAGQITAGNWRDLDNWEKWKETNKDATIASYQTKWGFNHQNRFSVQFLDKDGKAIIGAHVELKDNFKTQIWETYTDNQGRAELWANVNSDNKNSLENKYKVYVQAGEKNYDFPIKAYAGAADVFNLPITKTPEATADIAFVVDATGSMGDEIQYLQSELLDVATRVKKSNTCLNLRMGSVFYRDHGDAYVTVKSDFSSNVTDVANFIYDQSAGGGGDFPEAVDDALETAVDGLKWSENAIAKIMFLVLDAPPHEDAANKIKMQKYAKLAAQKGIKIIPIVASGINQSTEFLMKYLAITTNGTYVYITDHSGIGNTHEKPTGVKENVQFLNDLMVDIINENTKWDGCKDSIDNNNSQQGTVEILTNGQWQVQVYPNPAVDNIIVKSNELPDEIGVYDMRGNLIKKVDQISPEKNIITVDEISTGVYILRCRKGESMVSCRILVMH